MPSKNNRYPEKTEWAVAFSPTFQVPKHSKRSGFESRLESGDRTVAPDCGSLEPALGFLSWGYREGGGSLHWYDEFGNPLGPPMPDAGE